MSDAGANRKFTVSHEFGHSLAAARGGIPRACTFNDSAKCPSTSGDHAMASMEHATCALNEAFAHFVAADTYNNHAEDDCAFNYYKNYFPADPDLGEQVVDCEASSTDLSALEVGTTPSWLLHPIATLENVDPPNFSSAGCSTPYSGKATEVDWLRVLWNMHTDGTSPSTFNQILDWILNANVGSQTVFTELDAEANSVGGSLNSSWDSNKGKHAVDN